MSSSYDSGDGSPSHTDCNDDNNSSTIMIQLAQNICQAMENEDSSASSSSRLPESLSSLLNLNNNNNNNESGDDGCENNQKCLPSQEYHNLLHIFYLSIGLRSNNDKINNYDDAKLQLSLIDDNNIKSHLLLRALLRVGAICNHHSSGDNNSSGNIDSHISGDYENVAQASTEDTIISLSWEAVITTIQSLQPQSSSSNTTTTTTSSTSSVVGEQSKMKLISEIHQFIIALTSVLLSRNCVNNINSSNNNNGSDSGSDNNNNSCSSDYNNSSDNRNELSTKHNQINASITNIKYVLERLLHLGQIIIAPLLLLDKLPQIEWSKQKQQSQQQQQTQQQSPQRRGHSNNNNSNASNNNSATLLSLELLPIIFTSMDKLEDYLSDLLLVHDELQMRLSELHEEEEYGVHVDAMDVDGDVAGGHVDGRDVELGKDDVDDNNGNNNDDNNGNNNDDNNEKNEDKSSEEVMIRYSDKLLSSIFVPPFKNNCSNSSVVDDDENIISDGNSSNIHVRGDAILPLLALAIDDIGHDRMITSVPSQHLIIDSITSNSCSSTSQYYHEEDISYWDCLKLVLHQMIQINLRYFTGNDEGDTAGQRGGLVNNETEEEGEEVYLIAPSDYPALIRCVFRMITMNYASSSSLQDDNSIGWESILLQLYHASAVISATLPSRRLHRQLFRSGGGGVDSYSASATLSTVENHVLLPSFTGASVVAIRSVLDACLNESCCTSCSNKRITSCWWQKDLGATATSSPPNWAIAGIVLLIMRSRSSNLSNSSSSFGPRAVFRIASDIMRNMASKDKGTNIDIKDKQRIGLGGDDEVGYALTVLLALRGGVGGGDEGSECCLMCSDIRCSGDDVDKCALDVLRNVYYAGGGLFRHKYLSNDGGREKSRPYEYQLGHKTLTQYASLVCSSINQGKIGNNCGRMKSSESSSTSETAKTWVDAAYMLLDEMSVADSKGAQATISQKTTDDSIPDGTAMALTIIVVVFCEVPSSQHEIVRSVYDRLINSSSRRMGNSSKGKRSENCFILASLLAWSLVASYDTSASQDDVVVRRKGQKDDDIKAVLGPLCNLLITPAPVYDIVLDTEKPSLSYSALQQLSRPLAPIPSGREAILAMAKKHLRMSSTSSPYSYSSVHTVMPFSESMPSTPSATRDVLNFAVDCLCTLIESHDPSNEHSIPDEYGCEALVMISDIIASSVTGLNSSWVMPQRVISRLLQELMASVKQSRLNGWVLQRLMRSCFVALVKFFGSESKSSSPVLMTRRVFRSTNDGQGFQTTADVVTILQLIMSIHRSSGAGDGSGTFNSLLKRQIISVLLPGMTPQTASDESSQEVGVDEKASADNVDSTCLAFLLQGVAWTVQSDASAKNVTVESNVVQQMMHDIIYAERACFRDANLHQNTIPTWLEASHTSPISSAYCEIPVSAVDSLKSSRDYTLFFASLCDIVVDALLQGDVPDDDKESKFMDDILRVIHRVLDSKQRVCGGKISLSSKVDSQDASDTSQLLLDLSSQHLHRLLVSNAALPEIDLILQNILRCCDESIESSGGHPVASTWKLYCSLGDEQSSQLLISSIKDHFLKKRNRWARQRTNQSADFSLLSISSPDSLEEHVRYVRSMILEKVSSDLTYCVASKAVLSLEERVADLSVYLQLLLQLCEDWRAGYHGLSGGMSKDIANMFLETTDRCTNAILYSVDHLPGKVVLGMKGGFANVVNSISTVWGIFCEENVVGFGDKANRMRGTLRLCVDKMPQLLRRVERLVGEPVVEEKLGDHYITLLDQCLLQLKNECGSVVKNAIALTDETVGHGKNDEGDGEEYEFEVANEKEPVTMLNISSESIHWAYNCAFTAIQKIWSEHYKVISCRGKNISHVVSPGSWERSATLSLRKRREISSTLTAICKILGETSGARYDSMAKNSIVYAELFTYQGKSSLCKCIESITMTLVYSIKRIIQFLLDDRRQRSQKQETMSLNEIKLRELMICILGLLSSVRESEATNDIFTGPLQWYKNEKENLNASMFERSQDYPVLNRLPKLIYRLEVLEAEMGKLIIVLNDARRRVVYKEKVSLLDQLTAELTGGEEASLSFLELLQHYAGMTTSLKKEMKIDDIEDDALRGKDDGESDAEGDFDTSRAKRPRQHFFGPRRKRRMSLRSRNATIDDWLTADNDDLDPGESHNYVDAYVDLEDFIVDG
jgi:hypothetical protein